jgi:hypothetical protein
LILTIDNFPSRPIFKTMCNRVVQNDLIVKPGGKITVLMKGPGGEFELPFNEAIFGGPAKKESRCLRTATIGSSARVRWMCSCRT